MEAKTKVERKRTSAALKLRDNQWFVNQSLLQGQDEWEPVEFNTDKKLRDDFGGGTFKLVFTGGGVALVCGEFVTYLDLPKTKEGGRNYKRWAFVKTNVYEFRTRKPSWPNEEPKKHLVAMSTEMINALGQLSAIKKNR